MWKTIVRRLIILIPQLVVLSLLIFFLASMMPGDALRGNIGPDVTMEQYMAMREAHGLNDPWYVQYFRWVGAIFQGDFGRSLTHNRPVTDLIGERMANTVRLSILTTLFTYALAIPLGIIAARKKGTIIDRSIMIYTFIALSMPSLVLGLINIMVFGFQLSIFPTMGSVDPTVASGSMAYWLSRIEHLILPALTMALISTVAIIYFLRSEIIDNESSDFAITARSKGVPQKRVYTKHILRNSLLPIAGGFGFIIVGLFTGAIFIERVFSFHGMGDLFFSSLVGRDFPVANVLIMFYAVMSIIGFLTTDILLSLIDPRIRIK